jgi:hypothetical protein
MSKVESEERRMTVRSDFHCGGMNEGTTAMIDADWVRDGRGEAVYLTA